MFFVCEIKPVMKSNGFLKQYLLITAAAEKCPLQPMPGSDRSSVRTQRVYIMFNIWEMRTSVARLAANKYWGQGSA